MQIVGLKGALHTVTVLSGATDHVHGARLGQAGEIEILFEMQSEPSLLCIRDSLTRP